jgi:multidrug efflux pump subunit AcrA (membrane-fusion protein)
MGVISMIRNLFILFLSMELFATALQPDATEDLSLPYLFMLTPYIRTSYSSVNNSKIEKIYKRMGDSFQKGEILLQLETVIQKSLYDKAVAVLEKTERIYESKKILFEGKVASLDELIALKTDWIIAKNEVVIAKKNLDDCSVVALYNGKVAYVNVEEGEYPNHEFYYKDRPMMETIDEDILLAKILIPVHLLAHVRIGQKVLLKIKEVKEELSVPITRVGAVIDPVSGTIPVEAEVNNFEKRLMAGMTGTARLQLTPSEGAQ